MLSGPTDRAPFTPRRPDLVAFLCTTVFVLVLCAPMFAGKFLVGLHSDQYIAGYGFREFWTEQVRAHGSVPLWNPYIFGGLPYVGAMHGDLLYPFTWIRLVVPTDVAMNLAFLVHLMLAGFFTYLLLRVLRLPWVACVTGGIAYQLTGIVASLVRPGHDGKLYVSALLPLVLLALVKWIRDGKWPGLGVLGFGVGLAILSPSFQMAYYLLLAGGLFALYLALFDPDRPERGTVGPRLALALGTVILGFGVAAVQVLPFLTYLPFSPRSVPGASSGWAYATSYSLPPEELLDTLLPEFSGLEPARYWGRNPLKFHSEYLGVVTLILASVGLARTERRRLRWAFVAIAGFFLLVSLGGHTPFYRLVYELLPFMQKVRAPGMAFFLVAFPVAVWAALGVERILAGEGRLGAVRNWLVALGVIVLLAAAGMFTNLARSIADPGRVGSAVANQGAVALGALRIALFGSMLAIVVFAWRRGKLSARATALALPALVGLDLFSVDWRFFWPNFSPRASVLYAPDPVTERIKQTPPPYRVLNVAYPGSILMAHDIPEVLGYHGNEIRFYDDLLGGKNVWRHLGMPQLWELLAVRFVVLSDTTPVPGFRRALGPVRTTPGQVAYLLEADTAPPYARVVPAAIKIDADGVIPTLLDPRLDFDRVVLFDREQAVSPAPVQRMPEPSPARARVTAWEPGRMTVALDPAPPGPSYLVVAENWYPDWQATVDAAPAHVLRGNYALITVALPAGACQVELVFRSAAYRTGQLVTLAAVLLLLGMVAGPAAYRRWGRTGATGGTGGTRA